MAVVKKGVVPSKLPTPPGAAALLDEPSNLVLYGDSGTGKSVGAAFAFGADYLFVVDDRQVMRGIASLLRDKPDEMLAKYGLHDLPEHYAIPAERMPKTGEEPPAPSKRSITDKRWTIPVDNLRTIVRILKRAVDAKQAGGGFLWKCADGQTRLMRGIVYDEWTGFCSRIDAQLRTEFGEDNGFEVNRRHHALMRFMRSVSEVSGISLVFVCHAAGPAYHATAGDPQASKVPSALQGTLKYPGIPKLPTAPLAQALCASVSYVFRFYVGAGASLDSDGADRRVQTAISPLWYAKGRDFALPAEIDLNETDLRAALAQAGCVPARAS